MPHLNCWPLAWPQVTHASARAVVRLAGEPLYQSHHTTLRIALAQFANAVETGGWGELYVALSALARTFPSEETLAIQSIQQLDQATPLLPMLGLASNKFTARQAAQQVGALSGRIIIVPAGSERRFLEPLPLKVLPDPPAEFLRRLHLFGITTLGGFARLPHAAVVLQFGAHLTRGVDPLPLLPQIPLTLSRSPHAVPICVRPITADAPY